MRFSELVLLLCITSLYSCANFMNYGSDLKHMHAKLQSIRAKSMQLEEKDEKCENLLNIHLIPHSHDDVGWLKTVEDYYWGRNDDIQNAGVQYIIDSVVEQLLLDPKKKFIQVEVAFFQKWWRLQDEETQNNVRRLIKNGQFEFINGGYCMNDEATPYYEDIIDQMTLGHQWLLKELGVKPNIGWQIDPFGHSSAQASLFAQMGFDAMFFVRIDYQDIIKRMNESSMEMLWKPRNFQGDESSIFAHVNRRMYEAPPNFCFDINCRDEPIMDDPKSKGYNIDRRAWEFADYFRDMCLHYKSNTLMHTMGSDFQYKVAQQNFKNIDKLVNYINSHKEFNMNVIYSTPSTYIKAIHSENLVWPTKQDDFFPYADVPNGFWTGYFISRSNFKAFVKEAGRYLQTARRYLSLNLLLKQTQSSSTTFFDSLLTLEEATAINQHHDAVSGTAKQAVTEDYIRILSRGLHKVKQEIYQLAAAQTIKDISEQVRYIECNVNETKSTNCPSTEQDSKPVLIKIVNGGNTRDIKIKLKTNSTNWQVINQNNEQVPADVICTEENSECDLFFVAKDVKGFGSSYYKLIPSTTSIEVEKQLLIKGSTQEYIIGEHESILFYKDTLQGIRLKTCSDDECLVRNLKLNFDFYESYEDRGQKSGAYIFRPSKNTQENPLIYASVKFGAAYIGKTISQFTLYWGSAVTHLRFYGDFESGIELETFLDSVRIKQTAGKEVILRLETDIQNDGEFYTDSNGLTMQKRVLNYRETWDLNQTEPVAGNYYPINGAIQIRDQSNILTVLNDRSQGGGSIREGEIEIMIQRRTNRDDARGVEENLNETDPDGEGIRTRMTHIILWTDPQKTSVNDFRKKQLEKDLTNFILQAYTNSEIFKTQQDQQELEQQQDLANLIPNSVKFYIRAYSENEYLIRFHNFNDDINVTFTLPEWLLNHFIWTERNLSDNMDKTEMVQRRQSYTWNQHTYEYVVLDDFKSGKITLRPQEIRTFKLIANNQ